MRKVFLIPSLLMLLFATGIGPLPPSSSGTYLDYAMGRFPGAVPVRKFAHNPDIDTVADEDIWEAGGTLTYLTSAASMEVISGSVNDIATTGSGCRRVRIYGLDGNFNLVDEQVATNGTSASTGTTQTFMRVYRAVCDLVGSYGSVNDGAITIRVAGAGSTQAYIAASQGQTEGGHYTIPAGYTGYGLDVHLNVASGKTATIFFEYRLDADNTASDFNSWRIASNYVGVSGGEDYTYWGMVPFPEKTDIRVVGDPAANDTDITVDYIILLVRNNR